MEASLIPSRNMKRVLVTGAAGFIGSHLLPRLVEEGYEVTALDKGIFLDYEDVFVKVNWLHADICNHAQIENLGKTLKFDYIIHLAALAAPRVVEKTAPSETFTINVLGTYNVLKMAKEVGVKRVVFPSTAHVYGISPKYMPTDEAHPLALQDVYTTSKILGEQLCHLFYQNHNISYVSLRMFNGYGPRQSLDYFIPAKIKEAMTDNVIFLHGRQITKDFIYVSDMVDAILTMLPSDYVGALNVGTGQRISLEYVADYIAKAFGAELNFVETEDRGPTHMQCDNSHLKGFGWRPKVSIEEGLTKTIEWFKSQT